MYSILLIFFCFFFSINMAIGDPIDDAINSGTNIGKQGINKYGNSADNYRDLTGPAVSSNSVFSMDGATNSQGRIGCAGTDAALTILVQIDNTYKEINVLQVSVDSDFDGAPDSTYNYAQGDLGTDYGIGGICMNGLIACSPQNSWKHIGEENCKYLLWDFNSGLSLIETASANNLRGCRCINEACSGSASYTTYLNDILRVIGRGVTGAIQELDPTFAVMDGQIIGSSIQYFGQSTGNCFDNANYNFSGMASYSGQIDIFNSSNKEASMGIAKSNYVTTESNNPNSMHNLVRNSYQSESSEYPCTDERIFLCTGVSTSAEYEGATGGCIAGQADYPTFNVSWNVSQIIDSSGLTHPSIVGSTSFTGCIDKYLFARIGLQTDLKTPKISWLSKNEAGDMSVICPGGVQEITTNIGASLPADVAYYNLILDMNYSGSPCVSGTVWRTDDNSQVVNNRLFEFCNTDPDKNVYTSDTCATTASDPGCRLKESTYYDTTDTPILVFANYQSLNVAVPSTCKTDVFGDNRCFSWWKRDKTYECINDEYTNFQGTLSTENANAVLGSLAGSAGTYTYTDKNGVAGSISLSLEDGNNTCTQSCKVKYNDETSDVLADSNLTTEADVKTSTDSNVFSFRTCTEDGCPYDPATETIVTPCGCNDNLSSIAPVMDIVKSLQKDQICSDGVKK